MTALERRSVGHFIDQALLYLGVFALSTVIEVFLRFTEERLALAWRVWLTRWTVQRYLTPPVYHRLNRRLIANGEVPNPDERMADDVRAFTSTTLSFVILLLNGTFAVLAFSGVMWSISPVLFFVTLLYSGAGSYLTIVRGRPLVGLNVTQLDKEANFRTELIHVRDNAESVALGHWEGRLQERLWRRIEEWRINFRKVIAVNRNLGFFTTGYNYMIQIIPTLFVAPLFFRREVEFGVVTQSAMAFAQLAGAFSLIVTQFQSISSYAAVVTRLGALDEAIEQALSSSVPASEVCEHHCRTPGCSLCSTRSIPSSAIELCTCDWESGITYDHLTLLSPADGRVLTKELSATVPQGMRLLIRGPNEEAKAVLCRATAGTWETGQGRVNRPRDSQIVFVTEHPFLPPATLRKLLTGIGLESCTPDDRILAALQALDCEPVMTRVGGLDVEQSWSKILSIGECQRLYFAHVLVTSPRFVYLNRAGTALGPGQLRRVLELLAQQSIAVVADTENEEPLGYYQAVLELESDGAWKWSPVAASRG